MIPLIKNARDKATGLLQPSQADLDRGMALHKDAVVIDAYGFTAYSTPADMALEVESAFQAGATHLDLQRLIHCLSITGVVKDEKARAEFTEAVDASGVTCVVQNAGEGRNVFESLERMSFFNYVCDELPHLVNKAVNADDIRRAKKGGRHCLFLSLNNPVMDQHWDFWDDEMQWLRTFYRAGIRIMHLTYNRRNRCGDGCAEPANAGLSDYGIDVIDEMNRLGIIVDVAHSGKQTSVEAAKVSTKPIVASHSGAMALNEHVRNKADDVIQAICDGGGYVGVCAIPPFLGRSRDIIALLDHIDYLKSKYSADHVAIGCDITYKPRHPKPVTEILSKVKAKRSFWSHWPPDDPLNLPEALDECLTGSLAWTNWPLFTVGMVQRGYSDEDIRKIIGGNCLRVIEACRTIGQQDNRK